MNKSVNTTVACLLVALSAEARAALPLKLDIYLNTDRTAEHNAGKAADAAAAKDDSNPAKGFIQQIGNTLFQNKPYPEKWQLACDAVAGAMRYDKKFMDQGLFESAQCHPELLSQAKDLPKQESGWQMLITDRKDRAAIDIYFRAGGKASREARLSFTSSEKFLAALTDPAILSLLSATLRNQLPTSSLLTLEPNQTRASLTKGSQGLRPNSYVIYRLDYQDGAFWPRVLGFADKAGEKSQAEDWTFTLHKGLVRQGETLFIHDARGRGADQKLLAAQLLEKLKAYQMDGVLDLLFGLVNASYVGIRVGYPLSPGSNSKARAKLISALAEVNDGPMAGARWIWDYAPREKLVKDGIEDYFSWYRTSFGWSFGLPTIELPKESSLRLDLVPRIGLLNVDARLPVEVGQEMGRTTQDFKARNLFDLGLETGAGLSIGGFSARLWISYNTAGFGSLSGKANMDSTSLRSGLDTYKNLLEEKGSWDLSLIAFIMAEELRLKNKKVAVIELENSLVEIPEATYQLLFAGLGLSLRW